MKAALKNGLGERYGKDSLYYLTVNTNINYILNKETSLNLNISNLLNRNNRIPAGFTLSNFYNGAFTKGRSATLTMSYKF